MIDRPLPPAANHLLDLPSKFSMQLSMTNKKSGSMLNSKRNQNSTAHRNLFESRSQNVQAALKNITQLNLNLKSAREREDDLKRNVEEMSKRLQEYEQVIGILQQRNVEQQEKHCHEVQQLKERICQCLSEMQFKDRQYRQKLSMIQLNNHRKSEILRQSILLKNQEIKKFMSKISELTENKEERWLVQLKNMKAQNQINKIQLAKAGQAKQILEQERSSIQEKMSQIKKDKKQKSKAVHELQKKVCVLQGEISKLSDINKRLNQERQNAKTELINLDKQHQEKINAQLKNITLLQEKLAQEKSVSNNYQKRLLQNNVQMKELENVKELALKRAEDKAGQIKLLNESVERLKAQLIEFRHKYQQLLSEHQVSLYRMQTERSFQQKAQISQQISSWRLRAQSAQKQKQFVKSSLQNQIRHLKEELFRSSRQSQQIDKLETLKIQLALKRSQLQAQQAKLECQRQDFKKKYDQVTIQRERLRQTIHANTQQKIKLQKFQDEYQVHSQALSNIQEQFDRLKREKQECLNQLDRSTKELCSLKLENDRRRFELQEKQLQIQVLKKKLQLRRRA